MMLDTSGARRPQDEDETPLDRRAACNKRASTDG
jgi:hypothetical protein